MLANRFGDIFLFLLAPWNMGACAAVALVVIYLISRQLFRAILLAVSFPGLINFILIFIHLEVLYSPVFDKAPSAILLPFLISITFPSLLSGSILGTKGILGLLTNKPDYQPNKIYIFMIVLQCALSAMTVYMTHFNDGVE
jgi:hypothetical protein